MESVAYKIVLILYGDNLDNHMFDKLAKYGKVKIVKKGDTISRVLPEIKYDQISFSYDISEYSKKNFEEFLRIINTVDFNVYNCKNYKKRLRLFVQSDYAQIEFGLNRGVIKILEKLDIDLDISILSWGGVEDT